jgi:NADH dehydrogenase/NADH:ubiquinone oxidoreductase subunit G
VEVLKDFPRTDVAILAALTNLEARAVDVERLERALSLLNVPMQDYSLIESVLATLGKGSEGSSGHLAQTDVEEFRKLIADLQGWRTLEYVVTLLRHYRPEFDNLSREEKHGLIVGCCRRVNALLEASKQLGAFLEYGAPDKDLRAPLEEVERYVRAAELKDVEALSDRKIGKILGIEPAPSDEIRRQNSNVRHAVKQGKRLFTDAWGEEEWQKRAESKRNESAWFLSLTEEEQGLVQFADSEGLSFEEALWLARETKDEQEEEQDFPDDPKVD